MGSKVTIERTEELSIEVAKMLVALMKRLRT